MDNEGWGFVPEIPTVAPGTHGECTSCQTCHDKIGEIHAILSAFTQAIEKLGESSAARNMMRAFGLPAINGKRN